MNALDSFTFLVENLPQWSATLNQLSTQVAERHLEFTRLSEKTLSSQRRKTGSTESLRPDDLIHEILEDNNNQFSATNAPYSPIRIDQDSKNIFREVIEVTEVRQKRKLRSTRSNVSGPPAKFRSRMSIIVYYDSAIQESFERLVRNIAAARNNLRKGKTTSSFKARMASLGQDENPFAAGGEFGLLMSGQKGIQPGFQRSRNGPFTTPGNDYEAFDLCDKDLEIAQSLCETGAHQFLRDGNCSEEIEGCREKFESCLKLAEQHVVKLRADAEKDRQREEQRGREEQERRKRQSLQIRKEMVMQEVHEMSETNSSPTTSQGDTAMEFHNTLAKVDDSTASGSINSHSKPGAIEVDDDSDASSIHIDLSAFRTARGMRRIPGC